MSMATSTKQVTKSKRLLVASIASNGTGLCIWSSRRDIRREEADWTEEPDENFDDKRLSKEYHKWNLYTAKDYSIKWKVYLVPFPHRWFLSASKTPDIALGFYSPKGPQFFHIMKEKDGFWFWAHGVKVVQIKERKKKAKVS
jgi:hypothetical protein